MSSFDKIPAIFLVFFATAGLVVAGEKAVPQFIEGTVRVSAETIIDLLDKHDDLILINSRKKDTFKRGYIEGSINLPFIETYGATLAKHIPNKKSPVVFYCNDITYDCRVKAAKIAAAEGYSNVFWFRGGIQEWRKKGYPLVQP